MRKATVLICLLSVLISCKRRTGSVCFETDLKNIDTLSEYVVFQPGTVWVYTNDSTGELDSQVLEEISGYWSSYQQYRTHHLWFSIKSVTYNSYYEYWHNVGHDTCTPYLDCWLYRTETDSNHNILSDNYLSFYSPNGNNTFKIGNDLNSISLIKRHNNLTINNNSYYNILEFYCAGQSFFWAKNIGLVKYRGDYYSSRIKRHILISWSLLRYKIIR